MRKYIVIAFVISLIYLIATSMLNIVIGDELVNILAIVTIVLAFLSEIIRFTSLRKRSSDDRVKDLSEEELKAYEGIEFHNDFSKVPAGEGDVIKPKPVNFAAPDIYHEINNTVIEDMKNAGLEIKEDKKKSE